MSRDAPRDPAAAAATAPPAASVLIPVRGAAGPLGDCLDALLAGRLPAEGLEILVAGPPEDGSLTAAVAERARRLPTGCSLRWLDNPGGSTPAGLNRALAAARAPVVLRLDAHALPAPDYVPACLRALAESGAGCVGGALRGRGQGSWGQAVALAWQGPMGAGDAAFRRAGARGGPVDTVYLGAWPRELLLALGGWDERLPRNQDYELALRLRRAGHQVRLDPRIQSRTLTRGSPGALIQQYWGYGQGRADTLALHPGSLRLRQALPALWAAFLPTAGLAALVAPGLRSLLLLPLAAYLLSLLGATALAALRRAAPARVLALLPGVYLCMHLPWGLGFWWAVLTRSRRAVAGGGGAVSGGLGVGTGQPPAAPTGGGGR